MGLDGVIHVLGQLFVKNTTMTMGHFVKDPNWEKFEKQENTEIPALTY